MAGALISLGFTQFLMFRINRHELMVPAVVMRDRATRMADLLHRLKLTKTEVPNILERLRDVQAALVDNKLQNNGLPKMQSPFEAISAASVEGYKTYVQRYAAWVQALDEMIAKGIVPLEVKRAANSGAVADIDFVAAIGEMDGLALPGTPPTSAVIATVVQDACVSDRGCAPRV